MPSLTFSLPPPVPGASKPCTAATQSRRTLRHYRTPPRAVAMAADIPTSDDLQPAQSLPQLDPDPVVLDPHHHEFVKWVATADTDDLEPHSHSGLDHGLPALDNDCVPEDTAYLKFEDEPHEAHASHGESDDSDDDDDDDDDDADDDDDDDDEDDELAARAADHDFEDDLSVEPMPDSTTKFAGRRSDPLAGVDDDDNDEVQDADEILEPIDDNISAVLDRPLGPPIADGLPADQPVDMPPHVQGADQDLFANETEDDIQNAANILSESGILGLGGVDARKRYGIPSDKPNDQPASDLADDAFVNELPIGDEDDDDDDDSDVLDDKTESDLGKDGLDSYIDSDAYDDEEFALTSKSSFGRVWEFNEDSYITITDPGQPYMYEMDVEDEEDQDMATIRRGKAGGWSSGLMSNSAADLQEGSKEWIARRAYELVAQSNQVEMFQWTRRHKGPPPIIADLYPEDPPPPRRLPRTTLTFSTPEESTPIIGMDSSGKLAAKEEEEGEQRPKLPDGINYQHALNKSIKFPCQYKFKVEGSGENLEEMLAGDLKKVLGRPVPTSAFHVEPAGKYKRVVIMVQVESALQVTEVYDALRNNAGVKFSFG